MRVATGGYARLPTVMVVLGHYHNSPGWRSGWRFSRYFHRAADASFAFFFAAQDAPWMARRLLRSCVPPWDMGTTWSAWSAPSPPQMWHCPPSRWMTAALRLFQSLGLVMLRGDG